MRSLDELVSPGVVERLRQVAERDAPAYREAQPFPHCVIDDFLPRDLLARIVSRYPAPEDLRWERFDEREERKLAFAHVEALPGELRDLLYFLNSAPILGFLEQLTGIRGLIPDPYYLGGGLHQIERGGHLGVHADFNRYEKLGLERRLNLLLYLNDDWSDEFGGHLELWDRDTKTCVKRILPVFDRCVVFTITDSALHGHPVPLACPPGRTRRSVATYYYTAGAQSSSAHSTIFEAGARAGHEAAAQRLTRALRRTGRALLPPLVTDGLVAIRQRWLRRNR